MERLTLPKNIDKKLLNDEFGFGAAAYYENRLKERMAHGGKTYANIFKTAYIWAYNDRKTGSGYYSTVRIKNNNSRVQKNYGGS